MSSTKDLIGPELLFVLALEKLPYSTVYNPASANIDQSVPDFVIIYMTIRSQISLIMGIIGPEHSKLYAFELEKNC